MSLDFSFARTPRLVFGAGKASGLARLAAGYSRSALLVTGARSLEASSRWDPLRESFHEQGVAVVHVAVQGEPSPDWVDETARNARQAGVGVVVGIGGGSAVDAGKAVSAMIPSSGSVVDYLEGVGTKPHSGLKLPFIAVPTTAGTGSEATKNAVLSRIGPGGFKKSLRHDNLVPDVALVDPELALSCPSQASAACGLDAFAQLLEGYVSTKASALTDTLALAGIGALKDRLVPVCTSAACDVEARSGMAYAAYLSGLVLANAGLGVVHGLAGPIGGRVAAPHGLICGLLTAPAIEANLRALRDLGRAGEAGLRKYAEVGALLGGLDGGGIEERCRALVDAVRAWTSALGLPRLGRFGLKEADVDALLDEADAKCNPAALGRDELRRMLLEVL